MTTETSRESSNGSGPETAARAAAGAASASSSLAAHGRATDRRGGPGGAAPRAERRPRRTRSRLHPRDAARALDAREPVLPGRGARAPEHPGGGAGAARGQPLGRQPHSRHSRVHARVQHLLRGRAPLPPARPQPRAVDARARDAAQVRHGGRHARERRAGARLGRGAARLSRRRLRGAQAHLGVGARRLRRPQGLHPPGEVEGRAARARGRDRGPGDRAVPRRAASGSPGCSGSTACSG